MSYCRKCSGLSNVWHSSVQSWQAWLQKYSLVLPSDFLQALASTSSVYQVCAIHYSTHSRQCPLTALHTGHCSGCSLALTSSWHIPQGPRSAAQIQSCWIWAPLRVFWDLVMFSQVFPRFWRHSASHQTARLSSVFHFFWQVFPSSSLKACLEILALPVTHVSLNNCAYFTSVASRWDCSSGPGFFDSSVSDFCPKGAQQRLQSSAPE